MTVLISLKTQKILLRWDQEFLTDNFENRLSFVRFYLINENSENFNYQVRETNLKVRRPCKLLSVSVRR